MSSKFNRRTTGPARRVSAVRSEQKPSTRTREGALGYLRDGQSELFLTSLTTMVGEDTFYETAQARDSRFGLLTGGAALEDPEWTLNLIRWLRKDVGMRSGPMLMAAHAINARLASSAGSVWQAGEYERTSRMFVDAAMGRADEIGNAINYWQTNHGRVLSQAWKRGLADAVGRLYNQRSYLKWDSSDAQVRFADVLQMLHPKPTTVEQVLLFKYILDRSHQGKDAPIPAGLSIIAKHEKLMAKPVEKRREWLSKKSDVAERLYWAGMDWRTVSGWLQGEMTAEVWEALIPGMGYSALRQNLRNFDKVGISEAATDLVIAKLTDVDQVQRSREFPMGFLSAFRATEGSTRWGRALDKALALSLGNIPYLKRRTLILVDTSRSMMATFSKDGSLKRWDAAVIFGLALASRCEYANVVSFSSSAFYMNDVHGAKTKVWLPVRGESLLKSIERWTRDGYFLDGGTDTEAAIRRHLTPDIDRVVILTDEQASYGDVGRLVPPNVPLYTWNLAGERVGHAPSGFNNRHTFGGLSDKAFSMISMIESGRDGTWPWQS
jgi:hypothetical protein